LLEFALHRADGSACVACDLAKIVRFVRVTEQPAEDAPAGTAKQQRGGVCPGRRGRSGCSHNAYNRTQSGNEGQTLLVVRDDARTRARGSVSYSLGERQNARFYRVFRLSPARVGIVADWSWQSSGAFKINEQRETLNTYRPYASDACEVDDCGCVYEPVALVDDADVVDRNAFMLVATEACVNVPTDHDPRANSYDRQE
jgi:hypothetical protein